MSEQTTLVCPHGSGEGEFRLSLDHIHRADARMQEVQSVTPLKAPELLTALNKAWLDVSRAALAVRQHRLKAENALKDRKAVVLMEDLPRILVEKQLGKANEELREAVLVRDKEYRRLEERLQQLEAIEELLKLKARAFDNAFTAVKRIINSPALGTGVGNVGHDSREEAHLDGLKPASTVCPVCNQQQYHCPGGLTCAQGHGF